MSALHRHLWAATAQLVVVHQAVHQSPRLHHHLPSLVQPFGAALQLAEVVLAAAAGGVTVQALAVAGAGAGAGAAAAQEAAQSRLCRAFT